MKNLGIDKVIEKMGDALSQIENESDVNIIDRERERGQKQKVCFIDTKNH